MKSARLLPSGRSLLAAAALVVLTISSPGLEPRLWISIDGRTLDAELVRTAGEIVELKDKDNRIIKIPKAQLSFGDLEYIEEFAPEEKKNTLAPKTPVKVRIPIPAKEVKIDTKLFKKDAGTFVFGGESELSFKVFETPHFKILYNRPAEPADAAELAERLWHDVAFFHGSFAPKWKDRKKAIILADAETEYQKLGDWYLAMLKKADQKEAAENVARGWSKGAASGLNLPQDQATKEAVFTDVLVIKNYGKNAPPGTKTGKGIWAPFRTHVIASDLLGTQAGGIAGFAKEGQFAIFTGYAFFKEIDLTGECATGIVTLDSDKKSGTTGGYSNARNWAGELKKRIRKGDVKPKLINLFGMEQNSAKEDDLALAYGFSRFLQSTPPRLSAFNKLMERISVSHQVPDPDAVAKIYGLENGAALEKDWLAWMDSGDFR